MALDADRVATRRSRSAHRGARRDAPDRGQPALGARPRARAASRRCRRRERADAAWRRGRRHRRRGRRRSITRSASTGSRCCATLAAQARGPVNVMTHCNAGALATCGWGTATAPLFLAHAEGMPLHVWVSETRPRLQGAKLTAWEMRAARHPAHAVRRRARAASLMRRRRRRPRSRRRRSRRAQRRRLQQDRHLRQGAGRARQRRSVLRRPAVADDRLDARRRRRDPDRGARRRRSAAIDGRDDYGQTIAVAIAPAGTRAVNYAFDVTPARLVTGLVTERGIVRSAALLGAIFPGTRAACDVTASDAAVRRCAQTHRHGAAR